MSESSEPTAIHCPSCGRQIFVDVGVHVECPGCAQPILVEASTPPPLHKLSPVRERMATSEPPRTNYQAFAIVMIVLILLFGALGAASTSVFSGPWSSNASMLAAIGMGYCFPLLVAAGKNHRQTSAITVLNLALGWTGIFWIAALIWAASDSGTRRP